MKNDTICLNRIHWFQISFCERLQVSKSKGVFKKQTSDPKTKGKWKIKGHWIPVNNVNSRYIWKWMELNEQAY